MSDRADSDAPVREVLEKIAAAWKHKRFEGLTECFAEDAVIVGPNYAVFASGREACAESYREFAGSASILEYAESDQQLRRWDTTAVYTFSWRMTYTREGEAEKETGTDQLVLSKHGGRWQVVFRYIHFAPSAS